MKVGVVSGKGGTGRTTTVINLASVLAVIFKLRVGILDTDKEGFATVFGLHQRCVADPLSAAAVRLDQPWLRGADLRLFRAGLALETVSDTAIARHISRAAADVDVLIIDTPGDRTSGVVGATLAMSDIALCPVMSDFPSLAGFRKVRASAASMNASAGVYILRSKWEAHTRLSAEVQMELLKEHRDALLDTCIASDQRVRETVGAGMPILQYAPRGRGARQFEALGSELLALAGWSPPSGLPRPDWSEVEQ